LMCAAGFMWLVLRRLNLAEVTGAIAAIPRSVLGLAVLSLAAGYTIRITRWWLLLREGDRQLKLAACVWPLLASVALNNVIPFRAGDGARIVGFRKALAAPPARVLATLVAERVLDLTVLLGMFFVGLGGVRAGAIPETYIRACVVIACLGLIGWTIALYFGTHLRSWLLRACRHRALIARKLTR